MVNLSIDWLIDTFREKNDDGSGENLFLDFSLNRCLFPFLFIFSSLEIATRQPNYQFHRADCRWWTGNSGFPTRGLHRPQQTGQCVQRPVLLDHESRCRTLAQAENSPGPTRTVFVRWPGEKLKSQVAKIQCTMYNVTMYNVQCNYESIQCNYVTM